LQPFNDEKYPGTTVSAGKVNTAGQTKLTVSFKTLANKHFFGFQSDSVDGVI
jgi:hypothetical protein